MSPEPVDPDDFRTWDDHWNRFSAATRLNPAQAFRRRLIVRLLGRAENGTILDIGCGSGDLLAGIRDEFPEARLAGIDQSGTGLTVARGELPDATLATFDLNAGLAADEKLAGWASHAVCSEVLEHMDAPVRVLATVRNFLKPGGRLVLTVPGGPMSAFDRRIGHRDHYTAARLRDELEAAGYLVETATGAGFPFFNLYRLVVVLRGERLADDIDGTPGRLARTVMTVFRYLLRVTLPASPWGWQIVAVAINPGPGGSAE